MLWQCQKVLTQAIIVLFQSGQIKVLQIHCKMSHSWILLQFQQMVAYNTVCVIGIQCPWVWSTCNLSQCTHRARFPHDRQGCSGCGLAPAQQTGWACRQCCVWPEALNALGLAEHPLFEEHWQASARVVIQRGNDLGAQIRLYTVLHLFLHVYRSFATTIPTSAKPSHSVLTSGETAL